MRCDEVREAFSEFYDDMLSGTRLTEVTQHLDDCSDCRAEWEAFSMSVEVVSRLGTSDPSPAFAARVRRMIEAPPWWKRFAHALFVPLPVKVPIHAVALVVLSFAGVMLFHRSPELRREAEVGVVPPASMGRQAPPAASPAPAPRIPQEEKAAPAERGVPVPETHTQRGRPDGGGASSPLPDRSAPTPSAPAAKRERAPSPPRRESAEPKRARVPAAPDAAAGLAAELQAEEEDLRPPAVRPQSSTAPPTESRVAPGGAVAAKPAAPTGPDRLVSIPAGSADELFSAALTAYARQEYARAIEGFKAFVATYPQDARVPEARFLAGEAFFSRQQYAEAILQFDALVRQSPNSQRVPAAKYREGQARLALGDRTGCQLLRNVATRYPQSREAASARQDLATRCP